MDQRLIAIIALVAGLAVTAILWQAEIARNEARQAAAWQAKADRMATFFGAEISQIKTILLASRSLYAGGGQDVREEWQAFYQSVRSGPMGEAIRSLRLVRKGDNANGRVSLVAGDTGSNATLGELLISDARLWDIAQAASRSGTMTFAWLGGSLSSQASLGSAQLVLPIYQRAAITPTAQGREDGTLGWIIVGFDIDAVATRVIRKTADDTYAVLSHHGFDGAPEVIYDGTPQGRTVYVNGLKDQGADVSKFTASIDIAGQPWTVMALPVAYQPTPFFSDRPGLILFVGIICSLLIPGFWYLMALGPARAEVLAREMSETSRVTEVRAREAEQRLQDAIESMSEGFALWSPDDKLIMANAKYRDMYTKISDVIQPGISFQDLAYAAAERGQHPLGDAVLDDWVAERVRLHRRGEGAYEQRLSDGRWILAREYHTRDGGILAVRSDITERKQQEEALLDSERRFRDLVECSSDWVWEMAADVTYTYVSPKIRDILGYEATEVIGSTPFYLMPPGEARRMRQVFETLMEDRLPFADLQNTALHNDGRPVELETSGVPVFASDGRFIGYRGVARDITQRKQDERILRESEERFRQIAETVPVGVVISKMRDQTVLYVNDSAADMIRRHPVAIVGEKLTDLLWGPEDHARLMEVMRAEGRVENMEVQARGSEGDPLWLLVSAQTVQYEGDRAILSASVDITANKMAQVNLIQTSKLATLGEMATGVAHELNQPLAIMKMAVESATKALKRGDEGSLDVLGDKLKRINQQVLRATAITDHMRILGRKTTGEQGRVDVLPSLENAIDLMRGQLEANGIEVVYDADDLGSPFILGDAIRLEQVFLNLLSNARDAISITEEGEATSRRIEVIAKWDEKAGDLTISFQDTGGGIDEQIIDRIFEPFFTTKAAGDGTGLGLSISYSIITELGGTLTVRNTIGGAEFVVGLKTISSLSEDHQSDPSGQHQLNG